MKSERMKKIMAANKLSEKETPYNFCDRWCEQCPQRTKTRCGLYLDELEQEITALAHGKAPDDPKVMAQVLDWQYEECEDIVREIMEEADIDTDEIVDPLFETDNKNIEPVETHPLEKTAHQYRQETRDFLNGTLFARQKPPAEQRHALETIAWYHTLLSAKLHRALHGLYEPVDDGEASLRDAVAQFQISKKSVNESSRALRKIKGQYPGRATQIDELLGLLNNVLTGIERLERMI